MAERLFFAANGAMPTTAAVAGVTTGTAIKCELVETDVAATVTAHVAAGVQPYSVADGTASVMTLGTAATGYTASAEGTTTATKYADVQYLSTNTYVKQFVLSREFVVKPSKFLRVRVTAAAAVNATCYVIWGE